MFSATIDFLVLGCVVVPPGNVRSNDLLILEIVEDSAELVISHLAGHEFVKARDLVQRRDRAAVVRRHAGPGMTDEEGEMKLLENGSR